METQSKIKGFFSYVRQNDENSRGSLSLLRKYLEVELWEQAGEKIKIFQDTQDIAWGETWKKKIIDGISSSKFFIAIVTPGYLKSQFCRFELEYFLGMEKKIGTGRVLPLIYIDTPELKSTTDPVFSVINNRQCFDWTNRRFMSLTSQSTKKQIAKITKEIIKLISEELRPPTAHEKYYDIPNSVINPATSLFSKEDYPSPDNFPDGWDMEWQPSFDKDEPVTPPVLTRAVEVLTQSAEINSTEYNDDAFIPSLYVPLEKESNVEKRLPKQITLTLPSTGDEARDKRRIKTLYGTLISYHGHDKFSFQIFENGKGHLIDFPNDTTRICPELLERLKKLMGEENWRVEEITFQ